MLMSAYFRLIKAEIFDTQTEMIRCAHTKLEFQKKKHPKRVNISLTNCLKLRRLIRPV